MKRIFILTLLAFLICLTSIPYTEVKAKAPSIIEWEQYLKSLDIKDPASITLAMKEFKTRFSEESSQSAKDAAFMAFRRFYYKVMEKYVSVIGADEKLQARLWDEKKGKQEREKLKKSLSEEGMVLLTSEGSYYIGEDADFLYDNFRSQISPGLKEFLTMRSAELKKGFTEDAGLRITWNELADRIAAWDRYLARFEGSPAVELATYYDRMYLAVFLTGIDNSRVLSSEKGTLEPAVQKAYEYYLKTYKDTKSAGIISEYYSILRKNGLKESHDSRLFLKKNKLMPMSGIQPPTR